MNRSRVAGVAIAMGALLAAFLRLRGSRPNPPAAGGWRDLDETSLSDP
ncbi:MAG: hypothetical protein ACK5O2_04320 [Microthrixaceae bacterium]